MLRAFKTKNFARWAKKEKIPDRTILSSSFEIQKGLIDADLGSGLIKKRVARAGKGKRGGYRSLIAFRQDERAVFLFGFSKKDRENLEENEKRIYKQLAEHYLDLSDAFIDSLLKEKKLFEVTDHEESG